LKLESNLSTAEKLSNLHCLHGKTLEWYSQQFKKKRKSEEKLIKFPNNSPICHFKP